LAFANRIEFWTEVLAQGGEAVLVPTTEFLPTGTPVKVQVSFPEYPQQLLAQGVVLASQRTAGVIPCGLIVRFDDASVRLFEDALRECTKLGGKPTRVEERIDCNYTVEVLRPHSITNCWLTSLSTAGACLRSSETLTVGMQLTASARLTGHGEAVFSAEVCWARPEMGLYGLRMTSIDPIAAEKIRSAVAESA
jgi:hypothetical protein